MSAWERAEEEKRRAQQPKKPEKDPYQRAEEEKRRAQEPKKVKVKRRDSSYERAEREKQRATGSEPPLEKAERDIAGAEEAIEKAESFQDSGGKVQWGEKTYDLGTTQGWKDYRQAIRDAKSSLSGYRREASRYGSGLIRRLTPEPKTARIPGPTEVGPPKQATPADLERLRSEGYELPSGQTIYIGPDGEPFYYQVSGEYLRSIGPPEPTEEQRRRQALGLPMAGLPGPANVPPPGSIGAWIQPRMQEAFEKSLGFMEKPFKAVTEPIQEMAGAFEEKSTEAAVKGDPWAGLGFYAAGITLKTASMGFDVATFELRPGLWVDVARSTTKLAVNPMARTAFAKEVARDPFGFAVETVGGVWLGGKLKTVPGELELGFKTLRAQRGSVTEGVYGTAVKKPTWGSFLEEWRAVRDTEYKTSYAGAKAYLEELKFMEESGISPYPEPITVQRTAFRGFEKVSGDTTSNPKFDALSDSMKPVSTVAEPYRPPKGSYPGGAYDTKLWGKEPVGGMKSISVLEFEKGSLMPVYKPILDIEVMPSYRPGIQYTGIDPLSSTRHGINVIDLGKAAMLSTDDILGSRETSLTKTRVSLTQSEKQAQQQLEKALPILDVKPVSIVTSTPMQTPIAIQTQTQKQKQVIDQIVTQIAVPIEKQPQPTPTPTPIPIITQKPSKQKPLPPIFDEKPKRKAQAMNVFGAQRYKYKVIQSVDILGTGKRGKGKAPQINIFDKELPGNLFGKKKNRSVKIF